MQLITQKLVHFNRDIINQDCNESCSVQGNGEVINLISITQLNIFFSKHKDKTILQNDFGLSGDN